MRTNTAIGMLTGAKFCLFSLLLSFMWFSEATAQEVEEVLVIGEADFLSIMPDENNSSAFGLDLSLKETPRSITEVREDLIDKFSLRSVDDLVRLTPGAFTSSFFGIRGAMDIRGEPADNYFRGFRRIANPGAFNTIVRGAEKLEILRGPVSPLYGNGSVGGQLNYIPKAAKVRDEKYDDLVSGDVQLTLGTYQQRILSGNLSVPMGNGGMHIFADIEDSESFYDLYEPSSELLQVAFDFDLSDSTKIEFGGQYQTSDSIQVPGWNRVTQDLIDNGTYITGAPRDLNQPGFDDTQLLPQESGSITNIADASINNSFSNVGRFCIPNPEPVPMDPQPTDPIPYFYNNRRLTCLGNGDFLPIPADSQFRLLDPVGTTQLDHSTTFIDEIDFADSTAITLYLDVTHELKNDAVWKTELFYDYMDHTKFQSWGFTADYPDATVTEFRTSYSFDFDNNSLSAQTIAGFNYRIEDLELKHAFFDETFDFRDISVGATPADRISPAVDNPLANATIIRDADGVATGLDGVAQRNFNLHEISRADNAGIFVVSNLSFSGFNMLLGARYDSYDVESEDVALTLLENRFDADPDTGISLGKVSDTDDTFGYNISVSYPFDNGLVPYVTYSESSSLSANQLGGISPGTVVGSRFLQDSSLAEIGLKFEGLDGRLYSTLTYYDQEKVERTGQTSALTETFADGIEFELRALVTDELSLISTFTHSDTTEIGDGIFTVINLADFAQQNGLNPEDLYGARLAGDRSTFVGEGTESERGGLPDNIFSLYGTYLFELENSELTASLGFTWVDETFTDVFESVELPSYVVWTGSLRYEYEQFTALLQVNNLFDEEYYTSADLFDSVVVKPSEGRTASLSLTYAFGY